MVPEKNGVTTLFAAGDGGMTGALKKKMPLEPALRQSWKRTLVHWRTRGSCNSHGRDEQGEEKVARSVTSKNSRAPQKKDNK
jgi:hypothetical protein